MMSNSWELQKAIFKAISDASINDVTQIVDAPITKPELANYPFIELGDTQIIPDDAGGDRGKVEYFDIHTWSKYRGKKEIKKIMGAIYDALHQNSLTVTGRAFAHCWLDSERVIDAPDGLTRHGVQTFKIIHRS